MDLHRWSFIHLTGRRLVILVFLVILVAILIIVLITIFVILIIFIAILIAIEVHHGVLLILIFGDEIAHVLVRLLELHLVHALSLVPVQERLALIHFRDLRRNALNLALNRRRIRHERAA